MIINNEYYNLRQRQLFQYEFFSEGPRGKIHKVIEYQHIHFNGYSLFNLSFGDWDKESGVISDKAISNNNDTVKILNTVAISVLHFMKEHPDAMIFAAGSTPSRTRLYQMNISKFLNEISAIFDIRGLKNEVFESFTKEQNYEGFLLSRKLFINFTL